MAKPSALPEWDTTQVNSVIPDATHKAEGWLAPAGVPEKPPFQTFNYWQNNVYLWTAYFNQITEPLGSVAAVRAIAYIPSDGDIIIVTGYYAGTENRKWRYKWNATSTDTDNNGTVLKVTAIATGRYEYLRDGYGVDVRVYGAVGDNATINTVAFQDCDDNESNWYVSEGVYLTDRIFPGSNKTIEFKANVEIRGITAAQGGGSPAVMLFFINTQENVTIKGNDTLLWMNTTDYTDEASGGIVIYNSVHARISGVRFFGAGGDCVAIGGGGDPAQVCDDVWVSDCTMEDGRRNGASIQNAINSGFIRCRFINNGLNGPPVAPMFGLDIEPNPLPSINHASNITVKDCVASGNGDVGYSSVMSSGSVRFARCESHNNVGSGFFFGGLETVENIEAVDCYAYLNGESGFETSTSYGIKLINCRSENNTDSGYGIASSEGMVIESCKSKDNTLYGYYVIGTGNSDLTITGSISDGDDHGLLIIGGSTLYIHNNKFIDSTEDGIRITNLTNSIFDKNFVEGAGANGLFHNASTDTIISNNTLRDNHFGLVVSSTSIRPIIMGNMCYNNGNVLGSSFPANIWLTNTTEPVVKDNVSRLTDAPALTMFGIYIATGVTNGVIQGNDAYQSGSTVGIYIDSGMVNGGNRNFDGTWSTTEN